MSQEKYIPSSQEVAATEMTRLDWEQKALSKKRKMVLGEMSPDSRKLMKESDLTFASIKGQSNTMSATETISGIVRGHTVSLFRTLGIKRSENTYEGTIDNQEPLRPENAKVLFHEYAPIARFQTYLKEDDEYLNSTGEERQRRLEALLNESQN